MTLDFKRLLQSRNLQALLRVIREGESSQDDAVAYRMRYGGAGKGPEFFGSFDQHPRIFEVTPTGERSSAAGAYQFTATTWDWICGKYGLGPNFDPPMQDCAAVALINESGGLDAILDGRLEEAVTACARHWASLPGSPLEDGGSKMLWDRVHRVYDRYGGSALVSAPIEERGTPAREEDIERIEKEERPMTPLLGPIIAMIGELIPAIAAAFGKDGEKTKARIDAAQKVVEIVATATGAVNGEQAVTKMQANPEALAQARAALYSDPMVGGMLTEVGGGITAAWQRNTDPMTPPFYRQGAFYITLLLVLIASAIVGSVLFAEGWRPEDRSQVLMLAMSILSTIAGYWLGSSFGSNKKTDIISHQQR